MAIDQAHLKKRIAVATKQMPADLVIKNAQIIDVFNLAIIKGDLAIVDGVFVGIGDYEGLETLNAEGRLVCPALIDGHVHIESSMVTPTEFSKVILPHGVTTVITDPHEIGNVSGTKGIQFMIDNSADLPADLFFMLPSCVPATPFENSGANLGAEDLEPFYQDPRVLGLAEVMDYPSLQSADEGLLNKLVSNSVHREQIDGHLAGLNTDAVNVYRSSGVSTDHECETAEEARERLSRGMYLLIREGSVAKNLKALIEVVTPQNARRCLFCTDDKHLDDLIEEGSIDHNIRLAIAEGLDPLTAIQMGSLNAAECYGLKTKGALAPGYEADFIILDDLETFKIAGVYKNGQCVARHGELLVDVPEAHTPSPALMDSVKLAEIKPDDLQIKIGSENEAHIVGIIPNQLTTRHLIEKVEVDNGVFTPSTETDQLKMVVIERHRKTGSIGRGIVKGFGLKSGALATTVAHDSHNVVAVGTSDANLLYAIDCLNKQNGGLVVVDQGETLASLPLPISGLLSDQSAHVVNQGLKELKIALSKVGFTGPFNPFLSLSFLTLPVIPTLKLTDLGLFDVEQFKHISVSV